MALPKIKHITFNVVLPSNNKSITLRPFTVKEEKILLAAAQSNDNEDIVKAIKQVLSNCIEEGIEEEELDNLASVDLEYLFIVLRGKTVGDIIDIAMEIDGEEWKGGVNINDLEVIRNPEHSDIIHLDSTVGVKMTYPSIGIAAKMQDENADIFNLVAQCIHQIFEDDSVMTAGSDFKIEEAEEFLASMTTNTFAKVTKFFETMPRIEAKVTLMKEGKKSKEKKEITLKGIRDFFQ